MKIENHQLKYYLKNVLFITGTAYSGKSTFAKLLATQYDLLLCDKACQDKLINQFAKPSLHPHLCYFQEMPSWQAFLDRSPEEYTQWVDGCTQELFQLLIPYLIHLPNHQKVIVDLPIPTRLLKEIATYHQVAVLLSSPHQALDHFFDPADDYKTFLKEQIRRSNDPDQALKRLLQGVSLSNDWLHYNELRKSKFLTLTSNPLDPISNEEIFAHLASHFHLMEA